MFGYMLRGSLILQAITQPNRLKPGCHAGYNPTALLTSLFQPDLVFTWVLN